jgi:hypothetical protein
LSIFYGFIIGAGGRFGKRGPQVFRDQPEIANSAPGKSAIFHQQSANPGE